MNIFILGASGFIGRHITKKLIAANHQITCCVRNPVDTQKMFPTANIIYGNFIKDHSIALWKNRLKHIDVVINCVGIFYHPDKNIIWKIHFYTPRALFEACFEMDVKKIIHLSALNVESYDVEYAKSKKALEDFLLSLDTPSIILKPSLVYGEQGYGGMGILRTLASFPWILPVPGHGKQKIQPVHVDDLVTIVTYCLNEEVKKSSIIPVVPAKAITIKQLLIVLRAWLGLKKAKIIYFPIFLIKVASLLGDFIPYSTINTSSLTMLLKNNIAKKGEVLKLQQRFKFMPRDVITGIFTQPSHYQNLWQARLVWFKPLIRYSLAFVWLMSALCSAFLYPTAASYTLLAAIGVSEAWRGLLLYGACILNAGIGLSLLINYKTKLNCLLQLGLITLYTLIISWKLPYLWFEPFGPIVKNIPLLVMVSFLLAFDKK